MPEASEDEGYNELLIQWLTDLRMGAKRNNSKAEFTYLKALKSVKEYKAPLRSGADCRKLKGFGEKICAMIDKKLKEHLGDAYVPPQPEPAAAPKRANKNKNTAQPDQPEQQQISSLFSNVRKRVPNAASPGIASPMHKISRRAAAAAVPQRNRKYIPAQGSSGFAILVALLRFELERGQQLVNKYDLQEMAQRYCTTNLGATAGGGGASSMHRFAGWASVKTLLARSLVERTDARNSYFYLTGRGRRLARNLAKCCSMLRDFAEKYLLHEPQDDLSSDSGGDDGVVDLSDDEAGSSAPKTTTTTTAKTTSFSGQPAYRPFIFQPGDYEVILCIDTRERIATNFCSDKNAAFAAALQKQDVRVEIRTLPLGDFVWIAREKAKNGSSSTTTSIDGGHSRTFTSMTLEINSSSSAPSTASNQCSDIRRELVLDWIIERKRIDDLAASIKDRRWDEQKFRLLESGIRRPTYLIEYMGKSSRRAEHGGLQPEALEQAMTNCEVDGFDVRRTDCFEDTVRYLTYMSRWIERRFATLAIMSSANKEALARTVPADHHYLPFNEWAINSGKVAVYTAGEMFIKQLLQVKGVSVAKARAIVRRYPTLRALMEAYDRQADRYSKHNLLTDLVPESGPAVGGGGCADDGGGEKRRRFGQVISRKVYEYYGTDQ
ncbi:PREDICTED: crossover junction endonuclease MUS81-like [Rhagoletis zephyria]|uniref:crossover junction endonuclease MUS81-like n=1 Tax=Rhagoletis zephyria TaxID=28612 RepID=UPI00081161BB|nr:PREDICTED: crossover junction endonuclease MUS81-like [Rhagoletis zephyria]